MSSWSAQVGEQQSIGDSRTDTKGYRSTVQIGSLRIDPHPQNGMILRRLAPDGGDVHSTRHPDEASAKKTALDESDVRLVGTWFQLRATTGNFYWISLDGVILLRGDTVDGAQELQPSFAEAMARAGATR
jgi:hypothetical protein